tara:strand:- start:300 stop:539 length:240 start_codon:yes stop_codon:yes gene_type:complete
MESDIYKADGFNDAIIGVDYNTGRIAYSVSKCITILMIDEQMTELDATEWFYFNVAGAYVGEGTPVWIDDTYDHNDLIL